MSQAFFLTGTSISELQVCRGCLATDVRLYDMRQNRLMETYSTLIGTAIQATDDLPHYMCSYCAALLLKCDTFRIKCIDAQAVFRNTHAHNLENIEYKKIKQRPITFSKSNIQIINIIKLNTKHSENTENIPKSTNVYKAIKVEFDAETNDSIDENNDELKADSNQNVNYNQLHSLLKKILDCYDNSETENVKKLLRDCIHKMDTKVSQMSSSNVCNQKKEQFAEIVKNIQYSNKTIQLSKIFESSKNLDAPKSKIETIVSNKETVLKLENLDSESKSNIVINEGLNYGRDSSDLTNKNAVSGYHIPIDFENTNESNSDTEDDVSIADLRNPKRKTKAPIAMNKVSKDSKNKKEKTDNLSKMYNMDDIDLSKEEQLKEIEDRKKSDSYLQATFKCDVCYKGFLMEETYNSHMLIHDDKSGKYVCEICHCHFMSPSRLNRHKSNHKKRYTCKECGFVTKYLSQAKEHFKWHSGVKDKCKYCGKGFSGQSTYYLHLKVSHPTSDELVRCEICGESCNGMVGLTLHEKRAHKEMTSPECYCSGCERQFYSSDAFKTHQGSDGACDPRAKCCVRCGMAFETQQLLEEHEIEQRKPRTSFKCEVCSKTFQGVTSYKKHLRTHSSSLIRTRNVNKAKKRAICEICGKVLANKNLLKQHHGNKHSTATPYQCTVCPKSFRSPLNLQLHTRTHTGERPYRCPHCSKAFKTYTNMKRHKLVHSGERPHTCEMCGKAFKTKCDAKTHIKTVHMKVPMPPRIRRRNKKTEC